MQITNLKLKNYGCFSALELPLAKSESEQPNLTIIIGENGTGKTTILDALATSLSWFIARIRREKGTATTIPTIHIKNDSDMASIITSFWHPKLDVEHCSGSGWVLAKSRQGRDSQVTNQLTGLTELAKHYREKYTLDDDASFPLIAYYKDDRIVDDIDVSMPKKTHYSQLDAYGGSLLKGLRLNDFFKWFRFREDIENECLMSKSALEELKEVLGGEAYQKVVDSLLDKQDYQLKVVRSAITAFMPGYTDLHIKRKPRLHISIKKHGEILNVAQLSKAEKGMLALVGDIARRLCVLNPSLDNPLIGEGIVMIDDIDDIDAYLHSKWQQSILINFQKTFPNVQLIATTHSPQVLTTEPKEQIFVLDSGELKPVQLNTFSEASNHVMTLVLDVDKRPN